MICINEIFFYPTDETALEVSDKKNKIQKSRKHQKYYIKKHEYLLNRHRTYTVNLTLLADTYKPVFQGS